MQYFQTVEALNDAQYVAPLVETGDYHSSLNSKSWFYVFDYQTKNSNYKQVRSKQLSVLMAGGSSSTHFEGCCTHRI